MSGKISRRTFNRRSTVALGLAAATTTASSAAQVLGANQRIRLGFIGVANRGGQLMDAFLEQDDMQIVALCDVDQRSIIKSRPKVQGKVDVEHDFRKLLDRKDIDAVVIATPDHWHAVQTVMACDAKKDVYVEKPLAVTVHEGRRMVEAARRNQRVVQVGTHRRSSQLYSELAKRVQADRYGKICISRAYRLSNMYPDGIGKKKPEPPPKELDWDMWLGPRPWQSYQETIAPYRFRWWQLFSSQMANWGVHYLDAIRWCTGELAPVRSARWAVALQSMTIAPFPTRWKSLSNSLQDGLQCLGSMKPAATRYSLRARLKCVGRGGPSMSVPTLLRSYRNEAGSIKTPSRGWNPKNWRFPAVTPT